MNLRQKCKAYKKYAKRLNEALNYHKKENSTIVPFTVARNFPRGTINPEQDGYVTIMLENRIQFEKLLFNHIHEHLDDYVDVIWEDGFFDGSKRLMFRVWLKKVERNEPKSVPELAVGDIGKYTFPMHVEFGPIQPSLSVDEDPWHDDRDNPYRLCTDDINTDNITWFNTRSLK